MSHPSNLGSQLLLEACQRHWSGKTPLKSDDFGFWRDLC